MIWANLLHLSFNMWEDHDGAGNRWRAWRPSLRFDEPLWRDLLAAMSQAGMNTLVIDLGDGVRYRSHPEIAVEGAWSPEKLRDELARARDSGLQPIPKLNFSTAHDAWLGPYSRAVSTPAYYAVCRDLIAEVAELFEGPALFHLGMDEETAEMQRTYQMLVVRQYDLWWHDFGLLCESVAAAGARPWIWSDYLWGHPDVFLERMPASVLQSNWYYGTRFSDVEPGDVPAVRAYRILDEHGYDQVPTASNVGTDKNFSMTVEYCRRTIAPKRLLGFLQTPWYPTLEEFRARHLQAIEQVAEAVARS